LTQKLTKDIPYSTTKSSLEDILRALRPFFLLHKDAPETRVYWEWDRNEKLKENHK
jgi:hypothetical protein